MPASTGTPSGHVAGRYAIDRALGEGATAVVYLARDLQGGRMVAIKLLRAELADSAANARFLREIRRTAELSHPRILPVLDSGEHEGRPWFAMPFLDGGTLRARLRRERQLDLASAIAITSAVAEALDYAHQRGLIHRDVKPENILFTAGEACLGDFGIARALQTVYGDASTSAHVVRGTPAYMSPEQAAGGTDLDGRSDVYSLACVFYEMVTGMPAFMGPTPESVIAQRFTHGPRDLLAYRPTAPKALRAVVDKGLAVAPVDRYRTGGEFAAALAVGAQADTPAPAPAGLRLVARAPVLAGVVGVAAVVSLLSWLPGGNAGSPIDAVDTTMVALMPIERDSTDADAGTDDDLLHRGMTRWSGVTIADPFQLADGVRRHGIPRTTADAAQLSMSVGAGRFVRARSQRAGREWIVRATLFDARDARPLYSTTIRGPAGRSRASAYEQLADSLLLRGASGTERGPSTARDRSLPAVQAFGVAQAALSDWDLTGAEASLQSAVRFAPDYARASYWLAQVRAWQGQPPATWASVVERALAARSELGGREIRLARALDHLAKGQYGGACAQYDTLLRRNDRDFVAWFGRGQCHSLDKIVVRDPRSPSGWRFRSSAHAAMEAYGRAITMLPSVHHGYEVNAFQRLRGLLLLSTQLIVGYGAQDSALFYARPGWIQDSLMLVPYARDVMVAGGASTIPPGFRTAIDRRRREFRRVAAIWSAAYPTSAGAKRAMALALEQLGDPSAIDTARAARRLVTDSLRRAEIGAQEFMLLVKFAIPDEPRLLERARELGDSLLGLRAAGPEIARILAPVSATLGHCQSTYALADAGGLGISTLRFSPALYAAGQRALVRAALDCGAPGPTPAELANAIDREQQQRGTASSAVLDGYLLLRPALLGGADAATLFRLTKSTPHHLVEASLHVSRGDTARAAEKLRQAEADWVMGVPTPDFALATARLWAAIGRDAEASRVLDRMLTALREYEPDVFAEVGRAASMGSAVRMRAEIAARTRDPRAAEWRRLAGILGPRR